MNLWRLHNKEHGYADCWLDVTQTGAYRISIRQGGDVKFAALALGWSAARQVVDDRRADLLEQGWQPDAASSPDPHNEQH